MFITLFIILKHFLNDYIICFICLSVVCFKRAVDIAFCIAFDSGRTFVIVLFAAANTDSKLYALSFEIEPQRDNRTALLRCNADKLVYLAPMQEQAPLAQRFVVIKAPVFIRAYVHTDEDCFARSARNKTVFQIHAPETNRFYLCSDKLDACLDFLVHKIVVVRLFVLCNKFCVCRQASRLLVIGIALKSISH